MEEHKYEAGKILLEVSRVVNSSLDPDEVGKLVLRESRKAMSSDHASLFVLDDKSEHFILAGADGFSEDEMDNLKLLGAWETISDYIMKHKEPLVIDDVHSDSMFNTAELSVSGEKFPIDSFLAVPLETRGKLIGALMVSNIERPGHIFTDKDKDFLLALSNNMAIALLNARLYHKMKRQFLSTITSLTRAIDAKDSYTSGHSERVMKFAVAIGRELELDNDAMEKLRLASLLHDIGKIGVKESILMKPAKLLGYERRQIRMHPTIGARIVETIEDSEDMQRGIIEHHERFDGKGYPNHLKGEQISLIGRIIAVADVFDALTTDRPYQKGSVKDEIVERIQSESAAQFDPRVVTAFMLSYRNHPEIWNSESGEVKI